MSDTAVAPTDDPRWLFADGAAALAGVPVTTWRSYDRQVDRDRATLPIPVGLRDKITGRKMWDSAEVVAWRLARAAAASAGQRQHARAIATHQAILRAKRGHNTVAAIAAEVGVSRRTVARHLNGGCACP